jgi:Cytochrome c554 and c-prime
VVDAGDWAWNAPTIAPNRLAQQRQKAELVVTSFVEMGVDGMLVGEADLALGFAWVQELGKKTQAPFVAANLSCEGIAPFPPSRTVEKAGRKIHIIGLLGEQQKVAEPCTTSPPGPALRSALQAVARDDLVVVLSQAGADIDSQLAQDVEQIDLIVQAGKGARYDTPRTLLGDAAHLASGSRGKQLGLARIQLFPGAHGFEVVGSAESLDEDIAEQQRRGKAAQERVDKATGDEARARAQERVDFYANKVKELEARKANLAAGGGGSRHRISNQILGLDDTIPDHAATRARVDAVKGGLVDVEARADAVADGPYVGSGACGGCHVAQLNQWNSTGHAHAWETLVKAGRERDAECFSCHATGASDPKGPQSPGEVGPLINVGCESCHGPGRAHVASPGTVDMVKTPEAGTCKSCHDGVRDEGRAFSMDTHLPRVRH